MAEGASLDDEDDEEDDVDDFFDVLTPDVLRFGRRLVGCVSGSWRAGLCIETWIDALGCAFS